MIKYFQSCYDDMSVGITIFFLGLNILLLCLFFQLPLFLAIFGFLSLVVGLTKTITSFRSESKKKELAKQAKQAKMKDLEQKLTEGEELSILTGELIHGLGNLVVDKKIRLGNITISEGKQLQEIGAILREKNIFSASPDFAPTLYNAGKEPAKMTRCDLVDYADTLINEATL